MSVLLSQNRRPVHLFSIKASFTSCLEHLQALHRHLPSTGLWALRAQTVCYCFQLYPLDLAQCPAHSRCSICIFKWKKKKQTNSNSHRVRRVTENTGWPHTRIQWVSSSNLWRSWQTFSIKGQTVSIFHFIGCVASDKAIQLCCCIIDIALEVQWLRMCSPPPKKRMCSQRRGWSQLGELDFTCCN